MQQTALESLGEEGQAFATLGPDRILDAVEAAGYRCDGRFIALNSYENRVYQVGIEGAEPLVAKFYRPGRWSDEQILEEHAFALELAAEEIPVVPPLADEAGRTLLHHGPFRFALFPRRGGRAPELDDSDHLEQLGRFIARLHNVGGARPFLHRPRLGIGHFGDDSVAFVLASPLLPRELAAAYRAVAEGLLAATREAFAAAEAVTGAVAELRLHGDAHPGNILARDGLFHIVDLDDARSGPAIQDLWMFLSGDRPYMTARLADLLEGYTQFRDFDPRELRLVEGLRALRMLHYSAWLARRWDDPAFPRAFPWFSSPRFWDEQILSLREQLARMDEPPLVWD